jgi:hypothetical protein
MGRASPAVNGLFKVSFVRKAGRLPKRGLTRFV